MRRRLPAGDGEPTPGQHGPGAGAGYHHQGPGRAPELHRRRRGGVRPEPHRHPGPRGLQLRGVPLPGRLRGGGAGGGLHPGRGGPDPGQHLPRHGARFGDSPGLQQNRPPRRQPRPGQAGGGGHHRPPRPGRAGDFRQAGGQHRRGAGGHCEKRAPPLRGRKRPPQGPDFRQPVRQLPGGHRLHAPDGGHPPHRADGEDDGLRCQLPGGGVRASAASRHGAL